MNKCSHTLLLNTVRTCCSADFRCKLPDMPLNEYMNEIRSTKESIFQHSDYRMMDIWYIFLVLLALLHYFNHLNI